MGARALESFCSVEHPSRTVEDSGLFQTEEPTSHTRTELGTKQHAKEANTGPSPIIKHFFVPVFAVVHAAAYAPIAWHRAQGAFIPKVTPAELYIMVVCPLERSWYRGLWDKKTRGRETRSQT